MFSTKFSRVLAGSISRKDLIAAPSYLPFNQRRFKTDLSRQPETTQTSDNLSIIEDTVPSQEVSVISSKVSKHLAEDISDYFSASQTDNNYLDLLSSISDPKIFLSATALFVSYQAYKTNQEHHINGQVTEFNKTVVKLDDFIQKTLFGFSDAYSFIEKTDRISASKTREWGRELTTLDKELEFHSERFHKLKVIKYLPPAGVFIRRNIERQQVRVKQERLRLTSYRNIFESMFHTEINNYKYALELMFKALDCHTRAVGLNKKAHNKNYSNLLKLLLTVSEMTSGKQNYSDKEWVSWAIDIESELNSFGTLLSSRHVSENNRWVSDILNYFSYIIFDNLGVRYETESGLNSEDINQENYRCMLPIVVFLELSVKLNPQNTLANNNLGYAYAHLGDIEKAEKCIYKSIDTNGTYALSRYNLAHILDAQERTEDSLRQLEIAAKLLNENYGVSEKDRLQLSEANDDLYSEIIKSIKINGDRQSSGIFSNKKLASRLKEKVCDRIIQSIIMGTNLNNMMPFEKAKYLFFSSVVSDFRKEQLSKDLICDSTPRL